MRGFTRDITRRMRAVRQDIESRFTNIYCVDDFSFKLEELKGAARDRRPSIAVKLAEMLNGVGVSCASEGDVKYYESMVDILKEDPQKYNVFVRREDVEQKILSVAAEIYEKFPAPGEFIKRVMDELAPEENREESVRLRLLKRFLKVANIPENLHYKTTEFKKADIDSLDESVFDVLNEKHSLGDEMKAFCAVGIYNGNLSLSSEEEEELSGCLNEKGSAMVSEKGVFGGLAEVKKSDIGSVFKEGGSEKFCTILARIRRRRLAAAVDDGNAAEEARLRALDKKYQNRLKTARDNLPKPSKILKACDALAKGSFNSDASVKEVLFLFAFAYDMKYYFDKSGDYNVFRDVDRNLFFDYYSDNLTRYLSADLSAGANVTEPSGLGVNLRVFTDVVFVYCLNGKGTAKEKIKRFYNLLKKINEDFVSPNGVEKDFNPEEKAIFDGKKPFDAVGFDKIFDLPEEEFCQYMVSNYYCDVRVRHSDGSIMRSGFFGRETENENAYRMFREVMDEIKYYCNIPEDEELEIIDERAFGELSSDLGNHGDATNLDKYMDEGGYSWLFISDLNGNLPSVSEGANIPEGLKVIMDQIKNRLEPTSLLRVKSAEDVTRTRLLAAYYHFFCLQCSLDNDDSDAYPSFGETYEEFTYCMDQYLEPAGYAMTVEKNLFDLMLVLFAYCTINTVYKDFK